MDDWNRSGDGAGFEEIIRPKVDGGIWMRFGKLAAFLLLAVVVAGCGKSTTITVSISPTAATLVRTGTEQFSANVAGISNTLVTWFVCNPAPTTLATGSSTAPNITFPTGCVAGGNTTLGGILPTGLYTAPAKVPQNSMVSVVAVSQGNDNYYAIVDVTITSGVTVSVTPASVTMGTLEQFQFDATVSGSTDTAVSWAVNQVANGNMSLGTISSAACTVSMPITPTSSYPVTPGTSYGCYTAPSTPQSSITITATAAADTSQTAQSSVSVVTATDPVFSTNIPLEPTAAVEGSVEQDVYLFGSDFFSTTQAIVSGAPVPTTFVNASTVRATIPSNFFSAPVASPGLAISLERQNGDIVQPPVYLSVQPTRPAVTALSPQSFPTSTSSGTLDLNGGYFSSSTQASSEGTTLPATVLNSRQLQVTLSSPSFSFATPGLVPILVQNTDNTGTGSPFYSSTNVAISPSAANIPSSVEATTAVGTDPTAVGIDSALGLAVVVDQGSNQVSVVSTDTNSLVATLSVGTTPTGVGVDDILHVAAVVNSAANTLSIVNLQNLTQGGVSTVALPSNPTGTTPAPSPYTVGVNSLTHRAVIAYASSNIAAIFDLSTSPPSLVCTLGGSDPTMPNNCSTVADSNTRPVSTGPTPSIAIEPQLNWALVAPGGTGTVSIVDLGMDATANQVARVPNVVASFVGISPSIRGVAIDPETDESILVDPSVASVTLFSVLNQSASSFSISQGFVATAVNPLTDVGVVVNGPAGTVSVVDLQAQTQLGNNITVGTNPQAVAIDPGKNIAVIPNSGDGTVSILSLGAILTPQITEVSPANTYSVPSSSTGTLTLTVNGFGFSSGAQVRLDGVAVSTSVSANGREATATVPDSMLALPRRYTLDVLNSNGASSNVRRFFVVGTVPIGVNPIGVAIDSYLNEALVTSQGPTSGAANTCTGPGSVSVVDLSNASVLNTLSVGTCPEGVAVLPRLNLGIVVNNGSSDASVVDYLNYLIDSTVSVGLNPSGVAIHPDTALSLISNSNLSSDSVSTFALSSTQATVTAASVPVDEVPFGLAVDPIDNVGIVTASAQNTVDAFDLTASSAIVSGRVPGFLNPLDAKFDPITDTFLVADSLNNQIGIVDAKTLVVNTFRVGIDPTALAYNFQTATGVTVDQATNALSIFNFLATNPPDSQLMINTADVEIMLPFGGSAEFSVDINPITNIATVVDQANGRLLLIPLP
jgi:DNA-binding beta-propeller fold protein YncE